MRGLDLGGSLTYADSKIDPQRQVPGQRRQVAAARAALARQRARDLRADERWAVSVGVALQRPTVRPRSTTADPNGFAYHGRQPATSSSTCACATGSTASGGGARHRQRQQRPLLGLPPVPAAHLSPPSCASTSEAVARIDPIRRLRMTTRFSLLHAGLRAAVAAMLCAVARRRRRARRERRRHRHRPPLRDAVDPRHEQRRGLPRVDREQRRRRRPAAFAPARRRPRASRSTRWPSTRRA